MEKPIASFAFLAALYLIVFRKESAGPSSRWLFRQIPVFICKLAFGDLSTN